MGKHAIGGMRSMMVPNRKADMRFRKKAHLRNKERAEAGRQKKGCAVKNSSIFYGIENEDVTHWMPLPEPPKGE